MNESQSSTASSFQKVGVSTSHTMAGYAVAIISSVQPTSSGRRPMRSEKAPITGSHIRLDAPTQSVTIRLSPVVRCSTALPNVGVYAVIM